ncbi:type I-E CRISPR-associated protein Cse2/CasB [Streptomyces cathayae]|uniref:Type I-E CRISPR-associated protein Cse2/CasB n=1 Tax=Streptomyces cathayae TaxID=3031124 RepID=A0ABY8JZR2_9ACTN|nr:type I-E CRISPR-associated protein Cse2/CasB [Streptomyces sp. HUAS 5]WGD39818.1 type I-E CRISPR-associated protein Cse2/CasB [Streptomyces sp. HUAS 5]
MTVSASASAPPEKPTRPSERFVVYVHGLCESKRARAELRRGLGLPVERCNYLHRYIVPWMSDANKDVHSDTRRAHYAVAALIAARPRTAREMPASDAARSGGAGGRRARANLGFALGQAVKKGVLKPATAESALHLMSRQSTDAIHPGLPALTRQLLSGGVAVDWAVLLEDLSWWNRDRDRIATAWLESYFRTTTAEPAPDDTDHPETPEPTEENER